MTKKYGYEAYLEDQKKREEEAKKGQIRYTEAAKASRIQYTLPQYQGKSHNQGKTYQWERDLMQNEKIKGAGNSYTKKFDALTASMGMTTGQAEEFRKFMDFQEDSKHVKPKMNKAKTNDPETPHDDRINQSQKLNYARDAHLQVDVIDGILGKMQKDGVTRVMNANARNFKKAQEEAEKVKESINSGSKKKSNPMQSRFGIPIPQTKETPAKKKKTDYTEVNAVLKAMQENPSVAPGKYDEANKAIQAMQNNPSVDTKNPKERDFLDDILGMMGVGLKGAFSKQAPVADTIKLAADYAASGEKPNEATEELARGITRGANTAGFGVIKEGAIRKGDEAYLNNVFNQREGGEKAADFAYDGLGYVLPGGAGYKALNSTKLGKFLGELGKQGVNPRIMAEAVKGLTVGAGLATGEVGVKEAINPGNQDYHENQDYVGQMAALGAGADVGLYGLAAGAKAGGQEVLGRMAKVDGEMPAYNGQPSDSILDQLMPQSQGTGQASSGSLYDSLIGKSNPGVKDYGEAITKAQVQKQVAEDAFVRQNLYEPKGPNPNHISGVKGLEAEIRNQFQRTPQAKQLDELINRMTGTQENLATTTRQAPVINDWQTKVQEPEAPVSMENIQPRTDIPINNWQDNVKNSQAPEEVLESLTRPETNPAVPKKPSEQEFIDMELAPFREAAEKQTQARQTWETTVKGAKEQAKRIKDYYGKIIPDGNSKDMINEIPPQFRGGKNGKGNDIYSFAEEEGFSSADEAIAYLKQIDADSKMKLKDLTPEDNMVLSSEEWDILETVARQKYNELHGAEKAATSPEEILEELVPTGNKTEKVDEALESIKPKPTELPTLDGLKILRGDKQVKDMLYAHKKEAVEMLKKGREQFKNDPEKLAAIEHDIDFIENFVRNEALREREIAKTKPSYSFDHNSPKPETEAINPAPASGGNAAGEEFNPLIRLNIQQHAPGTGGPKLISDGPMGSDEAITKWTDKKYERYVNSNHSAKVAEVKVLENLIKKLEKDAATDPLKAKPQTVKKLKQRLKNVKKHGSDFEKAVGNEAAAGAASSNFLKNHFKALNSTVKNNEEMAQFLNYQMAMDLNWRRNHGLGTYELPAGVNWGDINALVQEATSNPKFGAFNSEMRNLTQEWRDVMLEYGLINKEAHAKLSKNPHYMYLGKDLTHQMDNIDRGTEFRKTSDKRASGPNIVHSQTKGDAHSLFQNPIDNLVNNTFSVFKNAYKEETGRQALRLAKLDKDGMFFKEISQKSFEKDGGMKVANGGNPRYVRMQDDIMKMIKENDEGLDMNLLTELTSAFAGLKTRSLEYQTAALIRDTGASMVTSQIKNPLRYFKEYVKSLKNGSADAKKIGGYFDKAHNAQTAGLDSKKVLKEFQRQHGSVKSFDLKKKEDWKEMTRVVGRFLDTPFKYTSKLLGQVSDEIPRDIEVRETERLFMKQHGKKIEAIQSKLADVDQQLRDAEGITDPFDPRLQGIDKLKGQKDKLENMLGDINRDLKREQIYRSRDVINYSRGGRGKLAKGIRKYVIFANTTTQSKDKMIRSFIERPLSTAMKAATAMAPLVAAQKIMWDKLDGEDKDIYERVPSYIKLNNFVFVDKGNVYTVPKIQELALITNPIEAVFHGEKMNDVAKHTLKETIPYQWGNVAQGLVPDERDGLTLLDADPFTKNMPGLTIPTNVSTPLTDIVFNDKSGFNRKPISYNSDKANDWTAGVLKKIVGNNVNADRVDYLLRQYLGDYGRYGVYAADAAVDPSKTKVDELLRNLNPLQDRIYEKDGYRNILGLKVPFKAPILDKKKE